MIILAHYRTTEATQYELIFRNNTKTGLNELLIVKSELDLCGSPNILEIKKFPNFTNFDFKNLDPKILEKIYTMICLEQIPSPTQITLYSQLTPEEKYLLKLACSNLNCNDCPLPFTIGCFQLLTTTIHRLINTKIIKYLQSKLIPISGEDHVWSIWEATVGRKLSSVGGSTI